MPWTGGGLTVSGPVIEVLYVEHCPCVSAALSLVRRVCAELGLDAEVRSILITDQASAERARFLGSPTVRVAGRDVEPGVELAAEYTLECRLYRHEHRLAGYPQERWVREALLAAAGPYQAAARRRGQAGIVLPGSLT
jgi:hypothetical protein